MSSQNFLFQFLFFFFECKAQNSSPLTLKDNSIPKKLSLPLMKLSQKPNPLPKTSSLVQNKHHLIPSTDLDVNRPKPVAQPRRDVVTT